MADASIGQSKTGLNPSFNEIVEKKNKTKQNKHKTSCIV